MSTKHLTPAIVARTVHVIDSSGIVDLLCPPRQAGQVGRIGAIRENTRLWLIGVRLATVLGHETTVRGVHDVLTQCLSRDAQWDLGVLRPVTDAPARTRQGNTIEPDAAHLTRNGKPRKRIWDDLGFEEIGYDDLNYAVTVIRQRLDYGHGSAPDLDDATRGARRLIVAAVVDALIVATTIPRTGSTYAIDATGQWAWSRGSARIKKHLQKTLEARKSKKAGSKKRTGAGSGGPVDTELEIEDLAVDADGDTAPADQASPAPAGLGRRCLDAAWGYKTGKDGDKETGFGFHAHTIVRVPDPDAPADSEPILVDGIALTPANADVVDTSLDLIDRIRGRHRITRLLGDLLYTDLRANRWAVPLAQRGIEQGLYMSADKHARVVDVHGAQMQFGWLHCPAADMTQRPIPPVTATEAEWEAHHAAVEQFRADWAFDRKESGLGACATSKWVCPAMAGRCGCHARGPESVDNAIDLGLPIVTPPDDWRTRKSCTNKTLDFTPDPSKPGHQRKLMQREYVGSRRWRRLTKLRARVEGTFGILKNASRQRLRRGQNRLTGLAIATIITAVKISVHNEEQLRAWHDRTGDGPVDHPLLQPDPPYHGFADLTEAQARAIDARRLAQHRAGPPPAADPATDRPAA